MKRFTQLCLTVAAMLAIAQAQAPTADQLAAIRAYGKNVRVEFDRNGVPAYLMGRLSERAGANAVLAADKALRTHGRAFRTTPNDSFVFSGRQEKDALGQEHVRMQQVFKGLEVVGGELIVHMDAKSVIGMNGRFVPDLNVPTRATVSADVASNSAKQFVANDGGKSPLVESIGKAVVFVDDEDRASLAMPVQVSYYGPDGPQIDDIYVDATNGAVVGIRPRVMRAKFRKIYNGNQSCNTSTLPGTFMFQEGGSSSDTTAVAAYNGTGTTYDFYKAIFNRDSYDNAGATLTSTVHFQFQGSFSCTKNNAAWFDSLRQMAYGDGDGSSFSPLARSLDVTAHELTHAVTSRTANLAYQNQSGALNEGTSDILGESTECWFSGCDWKIGEDVYTPGTAGDALRYMYDPAADGSSADYYPTRNYASGCTPSSSNDYCGVHSNSGIANLAYYLMSQGGTHPRGKTSVNVTGITVTKAQQIWYRALSVYMTSSTTFSGARTATANAAADLYGGTCTATWQSVQKAWDAVGVPGTWSCGGGGTTSQLLGNAGFENGSSSPAPWVASAGVIDSSTGQPAHSGSWKAWMDGYGTTHTDTLYQQVTIPSTATSATLTFWLHIDTAETTTTTAYDTLKVQIRNSAGTVLSTLATYSNLNKNTGYAQRSFNVLNWKGQTIRVYFLASEDSSLQTSFVIDDTALNVQ